MLNAYTTYSIPPDIKDYGEDKVSLNDTPIFNSRNNTTVRIPVKGINNIVKTKQDGLKFNFYIPIGDGDAIVNQAQNEVPKKMKLHTYMEQSDQFIPVACRSLGKQIHCHLNYSQSLDTSGQTFADHFGVQGTNC